MVAKPLCPLYKNIIKPLDRARYPELRYFIANGALLFHRLILSNSSSLRIFSFNFSCILSRK